MSSRLDAIQKQLEFYFSDANLSQDGFFKWEILKSPDFCLSTSLLLNCNRIRFLNATAQDIVAAANRSDMLEAVEAGAAIRRISPVSFSSPENDCIVLATGLPCSTSFAVRSQSRVMAETGKKIHKIVSTGTDLPQFDECAEKTTSLLIDQISSRLSQYGDVAYVKIPRFKSSSDIRGFAFIQFTTSESAQKSITDLGPTVEDLPSPLNNLSISLHVDPTLSVDSAAWTPKMLTGAQLPLKERLARQFVWKCCSRRSKQVVAAFRRLCAAGYRLPNPMESEYRLVVGSKSTTTECSTDDTASLDLKDLRLLPYDDYLRWRPRFYTWLKAWTIRMNRKADILRTLAERKQSMITKVHLSPTAASTSAEGNPVQPVNRDIFTTNETDNSDGLLPSDYCAGTVVEVYWPLGSVVADCPPITQIENTPLETDNRYKIRQIRGYIERKFLQPNNLLQNVVHFDGNPSEEVQKKMPNQLKDVAFLSAHESGFLRCFIRFRDCLSADKFANLVKKVTIVSPMDTPVCSEENTHVGRFFQMGFLLDPNQESVYCESIIASKRGVRERRRKIQSRRRQRQKETVGGESSHMTNEKSFSFKAPNETSTFTRIVFDE